MLMTDNLVFIHVPRTGGSWIYKALVLGLKDTEIELIPGHEDLTSIGNFRGDKFVFAFVRHPVDWYASYWNRRVSLGWTNCEFDEVGKSDNLSEFAIKIMNHFGPYCTKLYKKFTHGNQKPDFIGKYENLVDDLIGALRVSGSEFDEDAIRNYPPMNCSDFEKYPGEYNSDTLERILDVEKEIIDRYDYEKDLNKLKLKYDKTIKDGITQKKHGDAALHFISKKLDDLDKACVKKLRHGDEQINKLVREMRNKIKNQE